MGAVPLVGKLVRLAMPDCEEDARIMAGWSRDGEYMRLANGEPAMIYPSKHVNDWIHETEDKVHFMIRTLADDRLIGECDLSDFNWPVGNAWVGIGVGERDFWGQGYGTDAMRLLVRYGFEELGLRRISLTVFEYNVRARRSYEKIGFQLEGTARQAIQRAGKRWDMYYMGILRREWDEDKQQVTTSET